MIRDALPAARVEVVDEVGDGNHFRATVVCEDFAGKSLVQRHQMVYAALGDAMRERIHALAIGAYTPEEWQRRQAGPEHSSR
ncbi:MAG: BolA family transcriptional regulator [Candidatus Binatia bacterium]|nr:MAG: BolA family transcriptional regulator [Candidatus Binatia bacterium]